jgi:hypothetical protein
MDYFDVGFVVFNIKKPTSKATSSENRAYGYLGSSNSL